MLPIRKNGFELRPWKQEDVASLAEQANNINVWNNVRDSFPYPYTEEDGHVFIKMNEELPFIQNLAIIVDNKAVGGVGIISQTDVERFSAEIGYWIGEPYWDKGIVTEAVKAAVDYFFSATSLMRLFASVFEYNVASMRVMEKAGFRKAGVMEKAAYKNGRFVDFHYYELLKQTCFETI